MYNHTEYIRSKNGLISKILCGQRYRSKIGNFPPPDYSLEELRAWVFSQPNFEKIYNGWVESGYIIELIPSIDRLDDYKPYTFDNIQLMTWQENDAKGHSDIKNGKNNKRSKAVIQMDLLGNFLNRHHSISHAARVTNISMSSISNCCNRRYETSCGFCWMFEL